MLVIVYAIFVLLTISWFASINWFCHLEMVRDHTNTYGWGSYKQFVREFKKVEWTYERIFKESLFDRRNETRIHAAIISFNGRGMRIRNPIEYAMVSIYVRKYIKKNFPDKKKETIKWG